MEKTLQELTIKDNFMFAAVMVDEDNCKNLLELVLKIKIARITVHAEKTIVLNPTSKGVRLDIEAEDENHTHYDVEMQVASQKILRRARYYHSQMDGEMLEKGKKYDELPDTYVIFICDYDPLGRKRYQYTLEQRCVEDPTVQVDAGAHTIFLSTKGENDDEISESLRMFLKFVGSELGASEEDFGDAYVKQLQESIRKVKRNKELGERYMLFQEMLDAREEKGRTEGRTVGRTEGRAETIFQLYDEKIVTLEQALEKLQMNVERFTSEYEEWKQGTFLL